MAFDAGKMPPQLDVLPELGVLAALAPGQGVFPGRGVQNHLAGRQHQQFFQRTLGTLAGRVKETQGLHLVPPELQTHGLVIERREEVDDPPPDAEFPPFFHHRPPLIAAFQEDLQENSRSRVSPATA